jgi:hypothetical protein
MPRGLAFVPGGYQSFGILKHLGGADRRQVASHLWDLGAFRYVSFDR